MKHDEFYIGLEFWSGGRRWRCTDVGSRTVIAICLELDEVVEVETVEAGAVTYPTCRLDSSWFAGPPYAVAEVVFDEYALPACSLTLDD